jgi:hypothetical protein
LVPDSLLIGSFAQTAVDRLRQEGLTGLEFPAPFPTPFLDAPDGYIDPLSRRDNHVLPNRARLFATDQQLARHNQHVFPPASILDLDQRHLATAFFFEITIFPISPRHPSSTTDRAADRRYAAEPEKWTERPVIDSRIDLGDQRNSATSCTWAPCRIGGRGG